MTRTQSATILTINKVGFADALGVVAVVATLAYLPGGVDSWTLPKMLVLVGGGLGLAPWVFTRWRAQGKPDWGIAVTCGAVVGLLLWGLISTVFSGAPLAVSMFGWWTRGSGWLSWLGAAVLLLGAATLSTRERQRTITWLLGGGLIAAIVGLAQLARLVILPGVPEGQVVSLMGNTNFSAAYFAMIAVLALGRAITRGAPRWQRISAAVLFVLLAFLATVTDAQQGEASLAAGIVGMGVIAALAYRGHGRTKALAGASVALIGIAALLVASFFAQGPLARLWSEVTFDIRQKYWRAAFDIMNGLPFFGTGPDGFSRYVAEYRSEPYIELLGPTMRVSAAHNIALHFGAVLGWPGLLLWITAFAGALVLLLRRVLRAPVSTIGLTAASFGALVTYVVQGMVSIDMVPLLTTGWIIAGLAIAAAREPVPKEHEPQPAQPTGKRRKARAAATQPTDDAVPAVVLGVGALLGLTGAALVFVQMNTANSSLNLNSPETAVAFITNPLSPCPLRISVTEQVIRQLPSDVSTPAVMEATRVDPRCPVMVIYQADIALQIPDTSIAGPATKDAVTFDPLFDYAWILRSRFLLAEGDVDGAQRAADEAARLTDLYPGDVDSAALVTLQAEIAAARN